MKYKDFLRNEQLKALSLGKEESAILIYLLYITNFTSSELYLHLEDKISNELIDKFSIGIKEYLYNNKPIQYLVGNQVFFGYDFYVDERVLIPRFETEELVENVLLLYDEYFSNQEINLCDVGTGSGAIGLSIAKEEEKIHVTLTDISKDAIEVAKINQERLGVKATLLVGDMLEPLFGMKFDILVSNPPYIPLHEEVESIVKDNEPNLALFGGEDGLYFYRKILKDSQKIMNKKCILAFEHGYNKNKEIEEIILNIYPNAKVIHKKDMQGKDRMTFAIINEVN